MTLYSLPARIRAMTIDDEPDVHKYARAQARLHIPGILFPTCKFQAVTPAGTEATIEDFRQVGGFEKQIKEMIERLMPHLIFCDLNMNNNQFDGMRIFTIISEIKAEKEKLATVPQARAWWQDFPVVCLLSAHIPAPTGANITFNTTDFSADLVREYPTEMGSHPNLVFTKTLINQRIDDSPAGCLAKGLWQRLNEKLDKTSAVQISNDTDGYPNTFKLAQVRWLEPGTTDDASPSKRKRYGHVVARRLNLGNVKIGGRDKRTLTEWPQKLAGKFPMLPLNSGNTVKKLINPLAVVEIQVAPGTLDGSAIATIRLAFSDGSTLDLSGIAQYANLRALAENLPLWGRDGWLATEPWPSANDIQKLMKNAR